MSKQTFIKKHTYTRKQRNFKSNFLITASLKTNNSLKYIFLKIFEWFVLILLDIWHYFIVDQ